MPRCYRYEALLASSRAAPETASTDLLEPVMSYYQTSPGDTDSNLRGISQRTPGEILLMKLEEAPLRVQLRQVAFVQHLLCKRVLRTGIYPTPCER